MSGKFLLEIDCGNDAFGETQDDAAPELLAFANRAADVLEYYNENRGVTRDSALCELFQLARAAIAKATGGQSTGRRDMAPD